MATCYVMPTLISCNGYLYVTATTLHYYFCAMGLLHRQCMLQTGLRADSNKSLHSLLFAVQSHTAVELEVLGR